MTKFTDKQLKDAIRQAGEGFSLSAGHKSAMRFHLMDVIKSGETRISTRHIVNTGRFAMPLIPIIAAIVLVLGGGTATLANSAKPGDMLYPVDQLIEQIQTKLTTNPEAKADLLAKLADERVIELSDLENIDITKLSQAAQQLWEQHRQDAIDRVNASIARVTATQDKFKERLQASTDPAEQATLQKIIDHLGEVSAKRADKLTQLENKTFPGIGQTLKQAIQQSNEEHKQELEQIREQTKTQLEQQLEAQKQAREGKVSNEEGKESENESEDEGDHTNNTVTPPITTSSSTDNQTTMELRIPYDPITGEINWDLLDSDHDGIPDKWDNKPNWPPHTMSANPQV